MIADNKIKANIGDGIKVASNAQGQILRNQILRNKCTSLAALANPTVLQNQIADGAIGVIAESQAAGVLERNDIRNNAQNGVELAAGATTIVQLNRIQANGRKAIARQGNAGQLKDNITDNKSATAGVLSQFQNFARKQKKP